MPARMRTIAAFPFIVDLAGKNRSIPSLHRRLILAIASLVFFASGPHCLAAGAEVKIYKTTNELIADAYRQVLDRTASEAETKEARALLKQVGLGDRPDAAAVRQVFCLVAQKPEFHRRFMKVKLSEKPDFFYQHLLCRNIEAKQYKEWLKQVDADVFWARCLRVFYGQEFLGNHGFDSYVAGKSHPVSASDFEFEALCAYERGDYKQAERYEEKAMAIHPSFGGWHLVSMVETKLGNGDAVISADEKALLIDSSYSSLSEHYFNSIKQLGLKERALKTFDLILAGGSYDGQLYLFRASLENELAMPTKALADYNRAIALNPNLQAAYAQRAQLRKKMVDDGGALADLNKALTLNPDDMDARLERIFMTRDAQRKLTDLTFVLQRRPDDIGVLLLRADAFLALKRYDEALSDLDRAVKLRPKSFPVWVKRGDVLEALGRYGEAENNLLKAAELAPDDFNAQSPLVNFYKNRRRYDKALVAVDLAIGKVGKRLELLKLRADVLEKLGQNEKALAAWSQIITREPDHYPDYQERARIYRALGKNDLAANDLRESKRIYERWNNR